MDDRTNNLIKVGIAGLGRSGWNIHARSLEQMSDKYQVVAVCDADRSRQKEAMEKFNCSAYSDFNAFLKDNDLELVIVATPSLLHTRHSIKALKVGKNVVCEKPMAIKLSDADEMVRTAKKTGHLLTIFQNRRYSPDFLKIREIIQSGRLGRIVMIRIAWQGFSRRWDWQTLKEFGGGSLNNTGPHILDQALQFLGDSEPKIFCHLERTLTSGDADDHVKIILQAADAPMIDIELTSVCAYPQDTWLVMGTQGGIKGTTNELRWKYFDPRDLPPRPVDRTPTHDRSYNSEKILWKEETWKISEDSIPAEIGFYKDLYDTLRGGKRLGITPESVRWQIDVLEKCHRLCPV